jgi:hypothetical protein
MSALRGLKGIGKDSSAWKWRPSAEVTKMLQTLDFFAVRVSGYGLHFILRIVFWIRVGSYDGFTIINGLIERS